MTNAPQTARNWIFTLFPQECEGESSEPCSGISPVQVPSWEGTSLWDQTLMKTLVYQMEQCPTTKRVHVQGVLALRQAARMSKVKQLLRSATAHVEVCKNLPAAILYCQKEETRVPGTTPVTLGCLASAQGKRSDLQQATDLIRDGAALRVVAEQCPVVYVKLYKGLTALQAALKRPMQREKRCALLWGETGTGKTRMAHDLFGNDLYRVACIRSGWFDGYDGERCALLDECGPGMMH